MEIENSKSEKQVGAIVLSSSYTALAVVRSLGRKGIPVWILDDQRSPTSYSRYIQRKFELPVEENEQVQLLLSIAREYGLLGWSLFPDGDKGASMIAKHFLQLSAYYRLTTPSWDILQWAVDKKMTYQLAAEIGVPYPKAFYPENKDEVRSITGNGQFPMIVKPAHHQGHDAFSNGRAWEVAGPDELSSLYDQMISVADPSVVLVQEMIPSGRGTQFSYAALCNDGVILVDAFAERIRLTPIRFGVSSYVKTIDYIDIKLPAQKWLKEIKYTGLVEIDFILDKRDGIYKMLDVNARAWGWIGLGVYAGVDFPYLMWKLSQRETVEEAHARGGVGWSRTFYDIAAIFEMIKSDQSFSFIEVIKSLWQAKHEMYVWDDLKPAFFEIFQLILRVIRKLAKVLRF